MVTWVLEENVFSERCFDQMVNHFKSNNIPYHIVKVIPFVHTIEGKVPEIEGDCVVYGSIGTQKLATDNGWMPGVWTNDQLNEKVVTRSLCCKALNATSVFTKLSAVPIFIAQNPEVTEFFIKPNTDTKEFAGEVITTDKFMEWYQNMMAIGYLETDDFEVMLSEPWKLGMEWRLVMVDGKVCECSIYKQYQIVKSERQMNPEVMEFAEKCASIHNPCPVFVMDITQTEFGLKVIGYNTFNSAGLYRCDVSNVIDTINKYIENS